MRGLVILLGVVLVAAVAAFAALWPRFADEAALRAELERRAVAAAGAGLRIDGDVTLVLLPWPHLSIERVAFGGAPVPFQADRVELELAPLALLQGRIEPRRVALVRPRLELAAAADAVAALRRAATMPELAGVRQLQISDGTLHLPRLAAAGLPDRLEAVALEAVHARDIDRLQVEAKAQLGDEPVWLTAEGGPLDPMVPTSLMLDLGSGPMGARGRLAFHGSLWPEAAGPRLQGTITAATGPDGQLPGWLGRALAGEGAGLPLLGAVTLQSPIVATPEGLSLPQLEVSLAGNPLRGALSFAPHPEPTVQLALEGNQVTVTDALERALRELAGRGLAGRGLAGRELAGRSAWPGRLAGQVAVRLAAVSWRREQVRRVRAELALVPGRRPGLERLDATLPGDAALRWTGRSSAAADPEALSGTLSLQAADLRRLLRWLGLDPAGVPAAGLRSLDLSAETEVGADRLALTALDARLDATRLEGALTLARRPRPRLVLSLAADRLDTAYYLPPAVLPPDLGRWRQRLRDFDLDLDLAVDQIGHGTWRGQELRARAAAENGRLTLDELRLADADGSRANLKGSAELGGAGSYQLSAELETPEPKRLLRLLAIEPPPGLDRLAPARLAGTLQGDGEAAGIDAELAAAGLSAAFGGTLGGPFDPHYLDLAGRLHADETGRLLEAFGWAAPPEAAAFGPLAAQLEIRRSGVPVELSLATAVGDSRLSGRVVVGLDGQRPRIGGELTAAALPPALPAALYEMLAVPLAFPPGRPWLWPGAWPRAPLDWRWLDAVDLDLGLMASLTPRESSRPFDARATLALRGGKLALSDLALPLAGGALQGTLTLEHAGPHAILGTDLRLRHGRAEALMARLAAGEGLAGELDLAARLVGQGRSIADLVASLAGEGEVRLHEGRLPGASPSPGAPEPAIEPVRLEGPLAVTRGVVTSLDPGLTLAFAEGQTRVDLHLDLLAWLLDARLGDPFARHFLGPPGRLRQVSREPAP